MLDKKIAILGCGFMAKAIAAGLTEKEVVSPSNLIIINSHNEVAARGMAEELNATAGSAADLRSADIVIIAFKPQSFVSAMPEYAANMCSGQLLISIMAGIEIATIESSLPQGVAVIRTMPNLALSVALSATGYALGKNASKEDASLFETLFGALGIVRAVSEEDIAGVTALSGSGPAYFYYLAECMISAAVEAGMDEASAEALCKQTFIGTAELWKRDSAGPAEMRRRITSAKGTTDAAIRAMQSASLSGAVNRGMKACRERSLEMAKEWSSKE